MYDSWYLPDIKWELQSRAFLIRSSLHSALLMSVSQRRLRLVLKAVWCMIRFQIWHPTTQHDMFAIATDLFCNREPVWHHVFCWLVIPIFTHTHAHIDWTLEIGYLPHTSFSLQMTIISTKANGTYRMCFILMSCWHGDILTLFPLLSITSILCFGLFALVHRSLTVNKGTD